MSDPLRPFWDFDDLDKSEAQFHALEAEIQTQLARIQGMREEFAAGDRLLDDVTDASPRVRIRIDLERGRLRRSSGETAAALPLFARAFETAVAAGEDWLAGDAAHMAALASTDHDAFIEWTSRGLELARTSAGAAYWEGPLLNNLGGLHMDAKEYEQALAVFEQALAARLRDPGNEQAIQWAREAVAEAREALGRK